MTPDLRGSKDFLAGLLFLAIGVGAVVVARNYPFGTAMRMGSGYFPTVLGGILVLCGVFLMARGARSGDRTPVTWGWKPLACIAASMLLFGFLLPRFGLALGFGVAFSLQNLAYCLGGVALASFFAGCVGTLLIALGLLLGLVGADHGAVSLA